MPRPRKKSPDGYGYPETYLWYDETLDYWQFVNMLTQRLYQFTKDYGETQSSMANKLHVTKQIMSEISRRGGLKRLNVKKTERIPKINAYLILRFAEITGISPNEILGYPRNIEEIKEKRVLWKSYEETPYVDRITSEDLHLDIKKKNSPKKHDKNKPIEELCEVISGYSEEQMQLLLKIAKDIKETKL